MGYAPATGRPTSTITPSAGDMGRDAGVLTGAITQGTGARGGGWGVLAVPMGEKNRGGSLLLLQSLRLPPPRAPVAGVVAQASSRAAPAQVPAHGCSMCGMLPLPISHPLPSPPTTVVWVETPAPFPAASLLMPAHAGKGGGAL